MKNAKAKSVAAIVGLLLFMVSNLALVAEAVGCNPVKLLPCLPSLTPDEEPVAPECCYMLKEQEPCLCDYIRNADYSKYINNPNTPYILGVCQVPQPRCRW
uniref:Bifunctional inhibitor/plant lipid transfer protein/seed storage helical domain-containing protein n=1 Tax=Kalanchoe fedtschenkoi TaxID=63787 RepID=A0A7N0V4L7_KALFE